MNAHSWNGTRRVHVSMSTISVAMSRRPQAAHRERQQHYVAAPVFGRPEAAEAARLFIVAADRTEQIQRCQALFDVTSALAAASPGFAARIAPRGVFQGMVVSQHCDQVLAFCPDPPTCTL